MRKHYETSFKEMIIDLYNHQKSITFLCKEYDLQRSLIYSWIHCSKKKEEPEVAQSESELRQENKRLKRELENALLDNEILKKAAMILGKK
ncbi:MAG: transposase [Acholeplasmatales bacterium]|jgi:transposase|nr:transposase [Acholeplasmatales bacterium]